MLNRFLNRQYTLLRNAVPFPEPVRLGRAWGGNESIDYIVNEPYGLIDLYCRHNQPHFGRLTESELYIHSLQNSLDLLVPIGICIERNGHPINPKYNFYIWDSTQLADGSFRTTSRVLVATTYGFPQSLHIKNNEFIVRGAIGKRELNREKSKALREFMEKIRDLISAWKITDSFDYDELRALSKENSFYGDIREPSRAFKSLSSLFEGKEPDTVEYTTVLLSSFIRYYDTNEKIKKKITQLIDFLSSFNKRSVAHLEVYEAFDCYEVK